MTRGVAVGLCRAGKPLSMVCNFPILACTIRGDGRLKAKPGQDTQPEVGRENRPVARKGVTRRSAADQVTWSARHATGALIPALIIATALLAGCGGNDFRLVPLPTRSTNPAPTATVIAPTTTVAAADTLAAAPSALPPTRPFIPQSPKPVTNLPRPTAASASSPVPTAPAAPAVPAAATPTLPGPTPGPVATVPDAVPAATPAATPSPVPAPTLPAPTLPAATSVPTPSPGPNVTADSPSPAPAPTLSQPTAVPTPSPAPTARAAPPSPVPAPTVVPVPSPVPTVPAAPPSPVPTPTLPAPTVAPTPSPVPTVPAATPSPVPTPTRPPPTATPVPTNTPAPPATRLPEPVEGVAIQCIWFDGEVPRSEADEYVQIVNTAGQTVDLRGWRLEDIADGRPAYEFPAFDLSPGQTVRVYTNQVHQQWGGFSFGYGNSIWSNTDPDTAGLFDSGGNLVSTASYPPGCP